MSKGIFITGTDTGVGKTRFSLALMEGLKKQGMTVSGMKPIASGAMLKDGDLVNEDANLIMQCCSNPADYKLINPIVFELPVAPHIAASLEGVLIDLNQIVACYRELETSCEKIVVEGVGGWRVPVSDDENLVDLVRALNIPVILVVGLRLGCINHAILTAESIKADGLRLIGWASSQLDRKYLFPEKTIETLKKALACPCIANLPYNDNCEPDKISESFDLSFISGS